MPLDMSLPMPRIAIPSNSQSSHSSVQPEAQKLSPNGSLLGLTAAALNMAYEPSVAVGAGGPPTSRNYGGEIYNYHEGVVNPTTNHAYSGGYNDFGSSHQNQRPGSSSGSKSGAVTPKGAPVRVSRQSSTGSTGSSGTRSGRKTKSKSPKRGDSGSNVVFHQGVPPPFQNIGGHAKTGLKLRHVSKVWAPPTKGLDKTTFPAKVHEILR